MRALVRDGAVLEDAVKESIAYCINNDYLSDYFTETQKEEVFQMISFKWDEKVARRVWQEEAEERSLKLGMEKGMEKGIEKGMARGTEHTMTASLRNLMSTMHLSLDSAMDALPVPQNERKKYALLVKQQPA